MTEQSKMQFLLVFILFCSCFQSPALALNVWEEEREQGIRLEFSKNFSAALPHYIKALAAAPAANSNLKVQLLCQVATCHMHQEQRLKALPYIDNMLPVAAALRASKALKAETDMYLVALVEECESNHNTLAAKAPKEWLAYLLLSERICEVAIPSLITPRRETFLARCFLAKGDRPAALNVLTAYLKKLPPSSPSYFDIQLKQAALKNYVHQPEMLHELSASLSKTMSTAEAACLIAKAQIWAADYDAADKTLLGAYDRLSKENKLTKVDNINLLFMRLDNNLDRGSWAEAEKFARQLLTLNPPEKVRNKCLTSLSVALARQGKSKEAAQIQTQQRAATYSFLEDEERDALAGAAKRRAGY